MNLLDGICGGSIRYFGRTKYYEPCNSVFFNWSGSGFTFKFKGTAVKALLICGNENDSVPYENDRAYIGVFVDDNPFETARFSIDETEKWYTLAENLPYGEHTVAVIKETETGYSRAGLKNLACDGEFSVPPEPKHKKIEFIGDSITCGYGNICSVMNPQFVTREQNFSNTYAAMAAKLLDTEISVVAASGNGFFHDYGCNTVNLIPELYEYTDKLFDEHCGNAAFKWDFENDKCDAVVIKLGANDAQFCSGADLTEKERTAEEINKRRKAFESIAYNFFKRITELRKNTPILFICDEDMYLKEECLNAANKTGKIETLVFAPKQEYEGVGANGHYSVYTHARVAALVAAKLKEML